MIKTFIRKTMNWHTVSFTIWVQTFSLEECTREWKTSSLYFARWYKKMLDKAFSNLTLKKHIWKE